MPSDPTETADYVAVRQRLQDELKGVTAQDDPYTQGWIDGLVLAVDLLDEAEKK